MTFSIDSDMNIVMVRNYFLNSFMGGDNEIKKTYYIIRKYFF